MLNTICRPVSVRRPDSNKTLVYTEDGCLLDAAPRNLVDIDRRFRGAYCVHQLPDNGGSETALKQTSVNIHQTTPCNIQQTVSSILVAVRT
jgi:hypothetical protein